MRIRPEQLGAHLKQKPLAPIYIIHGDEPLLLMETADAIRHSAKQQGYAEREVLNVEAGFDWNSLSMTANSGSLFANQRLLELRLGNNKPGDAGGKAFQAYAKRIPEDIVLLIICAKLEQSSLRSRWFTALDQVGVAIQAWPIDLKQLPAWIESRMRRKGLQATPDAIAALASRMEGNLLAAAQEIDKLYLLFGGDTRLTAEQLLEAVSDSARFSIYDLVDAALAADIGRSVRILEGVRAESIEPILVLWALQREIRLLLRMRSDVDKRIPITKVLTQHKVWDKRKPLLGNALKRLSAATLQDSLQACVHIDGMVKGVHKGEPWRDLLALVVNLAGKKLLLNNQSND